MFAMSSATLLLVLAVVPTPLILLARLVYNLVLKLESNNCVN